MDSSSENVNYASTVESEAGADGAHDSVLERAFTDFSDVEPSRSQCDTVGEEAAVAAKLTVTENEASDVPTHEAPPRLVRQKCMDGGSASEAEPEAASNAAELNLQQMKLALENRPLHQARESEQNRDTTGKLPETSRDGQIARALASELAAEHDAATFTEALIEKARQETTAGQGENYKLKMTNRELYEAREEVARYIMRVPPLVSHVVQQQLSAALAEKKEKDLAAQAKTASTAAFSDPSQVATTSIGQLPVTAGKQHEQAMPRREGQPPPRPSILRLPQPYYSAIGTAKAASKIPIIMATANSQTGKLPQREETSRPEYRCTRPQMPNPMRIRSPVGRDPGMTRRQARRAEYDRIYGAPVADVYPSSDTDLSEEYTTSQENDQQVEDHFAQGDDWREFPWKKMRLSHKLWKRSQKLPAAGKEPVAASLEEATTPPALDVTRSPETLKYIRRLLKHEHKLAEKLRDKIIVEPRITRAQARKIAMKAMISSDDEAYLTATEKMAIEPAKAKVTRARNDTVEETTPTACDNTNCSNNTTQPHSQLPARRTVSAVRKSKSGTSGHSHITGSSGEISLDVPVFTGQNWSTFLNQFENVADYYQWTDDERAVCLHNAIRGDAANALGAAGSKTWSYNRLVEHMEMRHGRNKSYGDIVIELMSHTREPDQPLSAWHDHVINIVNTANLTPEQERMTAFLGFVYGLRANQGMLNKVLARSRHSTISEAFDHAVAWERDHGSRSSHMELARAFHVNMVGTGDEVKPLQKKANPPRALVKAVNATNPASGDPMSLAMVKVMTQIQSLGDRVENRFNNLDSRLRALEGPSYRGQSRGGYRGGFNNDRRVSNYRRDDRYNHFDGPAAPLPIQGQTDEQPPSRDGDFSNNNRGNDRDRPRGRGRYRGYYGRPRDFITNDRAPNQVDNQTFEQPQANQATTGAANDATASVNAERSQNQASQPSV